MNTDALLKMSELSERSGVSAPTIRHYIREGLLGDGDDIQRTSRNMAYYPPELVDRIQLIKRLQEERFMPLRVIKEVLEDNPERVNALLEIEDSILERALATAERRRVSVKEVSERYEIPTNVLDRLKEIGVLTPHRGGYDQDDVQIIEAISRFPRGRLRGDARLHRVRHAALPRGARAARAGGGRARSSTASSARWRLSAPSRSSPPAPSRYAS